MNPRPQDYDSRAQSAEPESGSGPVGKGSVSGQARKAEVSRRNLPLQFENPVLFGRALGRAQNPQGHQLKVHEDSWSDSDNTWMAKYMKLHHKNLKLTRFCKPKVAGSIPAGSHESMIAAGPGRAAGALGPVRQPRGGRRSRIHWLNTEATSFSFTFVQRDMGSEPVSVRYGVDRSVLRTQQLRVSARKIGSPGRIRTIDQPVNSRLLYR